MGIGPSACGKIEVVAHPKLGATWRMVARPPPGCRSGQLGSATTYIMAVHAAPTLQLQGWVYAWTPPPLKPRPTTRPEAESYLTGGWLAGAPSGGSATQNILVGAVGMLRVNHRCPTCQENKRRGVRQTMPSKRNGGDGAATEWRSLIGAATEWRKLSRS